MKPIARMSAEELAGFLCQTLMDAGVTVTPTGGTCVSIWSKGKYVSHDLDFIEEGPVPRRKIREVLAGRGFTERGRHFVHAKAKFIVEFPTGPLMVGDQRVDRVSERDTPAGKLRLLSPTDCVKDGSPRSFTGTTANRSSRPFSLPKRKKLILTICAAGRNRNGTRGSSACSNSG